MIFNKEEYEDWFKTNAQMIYDLTGVAHYNAANVGLLKMIFMIQKQIDELKAKPKVGRPKKKKEMVDGR